MHVVYTKDLKITFSRHVHGMSQMIFQAGLLMKREIRAAFLVQSHKFSMANETLGRIHKGIKQLLLKYIFR